MDLSKNKKFKIANLLFVALALVFVLAESVITPLKNLFIKKINEPTKEKNCYIENNPPITKIYSASPLYKFKAPSFLVENPSYKYDSPTDFIASGTPVITDTSGSMSVRMINPFS